MATTISSYAFAAPGEDVGGKMPEEDGSDSVTLPNFVRFGVSVAGC